MIHPAFILSLHLYINMNPTDPTASSNRPFKASFYLRCIRAEALVREEAGTSRDSLPSEAVLRRIDGLMAPTDVFPMLCGGMQSNQMPCQEWPVACVTPLLPVVWALSSAQQRAILEGFLLHVMTSHSPHTTHWPEVVRFSLEKVFTPAHPQRRGFVEALSSLAHAHQSAVELCGSLYLHDGEEDALTAVVKAPLPAATAVLWDIVWLASDPSALFESLRDVLMATVEKGQLPGILGAARQLLATKAPLDSADELVAELARVLHRAECPRQSAALIRVFFDAYMDTTAHVECVANAIVYLVIEMSYSSPLQSLPPSVKFLASKLTPHAIEVTKASLKTNYWQHFQKDAPSALLQQMSQ